MSKTDVGDAVEKLKYKKIRWFVPLRIQFRPSLRIRIRWTYMVHWLYWLSYRPRKCVMCGRRFWGCWYVEHCSAICAHEDADGMGA